MSDSDSEDDFFKKKGAAPILKAITIEPIKTNSHENIETSAFDYAVYQGNRKRKGGPALDKDAYTRRQKLEKLANINERQEISKSQDRSTSSKEETFDISDDEYTPTPIINDDVHVDNYSMMQVKGCDSSMDLISAANALKSEERMRDMDEKKLIEQARFQHPIVESDDSEVEIEEDEPTPVKSTKVVDEDRMSITIRCLGDDYRVNVGKNDTFEKIYSYISKKKDVEYSDIKIKFDGANCSMNQKMTDLEDQDLLDVIIPNVEKLKIHVKSKDSKKEYSVVKESTVGSLIDRLKGDFGVKKVVLKFDGQTLKEKSSFAELGIEDDDEIDLVGK